MFYNSALAWNRTNNHWLIEALLANEQSYEFHFEFPKMSPSNFRSTNGLVYDAGFESGLLVFFGLVFEEEDSHSCTHRSLLTHKCSLLDGFLHSTDSVNNMLFICKICDILI